MGHELVAATGEAEFVNVDGAIASSDGQLLINFLDGLLIQAALGGARISGSVSVEKRPGFLARAAARTAERSFALPAARP